MIEDSLKSRRHVIEYTKEKMDLDVRPNFKEIFNFVDGDNNDII